MATLIVVADVDNSLIFKTPCHRTRLLSALYNVVLALILHPVNVEQVFEDAPPEQHQILSHPTALIFPVVHLMTAPMATIDQTRSFHLEATTLPLTIYVATPNAKIPPGRATLLAITATTSRAIFQAANPAQTVTRIIPLHALRSHHSQPNLGHYPPVATL